MSRKAKYRLAKPMRFALAGLVAIAMSPITASAWSDTSVGYRYGTKFGEPFGSNDIHKHIFNFTYVGSYKYGINFINVDFLLSDKNDPANPNTTEGAEEVYVVYRNTVEFSKVFDKKFQWGIVKDIGVTVGFDWNNKDDAGYNSKKRMLVAGPTVMLDVPGFLNISVLQLWESNAPCDEYTGTCVSRYDYDPHPMLNAVWGIPIGDSKWSFEGFANFIAEKGINEFGARTKPETNIDAKLMYDASSWVGMSDRTFKVGLGYQYWRNKFGNDHTGPAGDGAFAKTPMVRAEYHF
jgi:hypothetical protein